MATIDTSWHPVAVPDAGGTAFLGYSSALRESANKLLDNVVSQRQKDEALKEEARKNQLAALLNYATLEETIRSNRQKEANDYLKTVLDANYKKDYVNAITNRYTKRDSDSNPFAKILEYLVKNNGGTRNQELPYGKGFLKGIPIEVTKAVNKLKKSGIRDESDNVELDKALSLMTEQEAAHFSQLANRYALGDGLLGTNDDAASALTEMTVLIKRLVDQNAYRQKALNESLGVTTKEITERNETLNLREDLRRELLGADYNAAYGATNSDPTNAVDKDIF